MQAEVKARSETLEQELTDTISRDFLSVLAKMRYVIIPKFNLNSDPEGIAILKNWDLWGPMIICLALSLILYLGLKSNGNQFGIIFLFLWGGSLIITVNTKLLGGRISFFQCASVLGYCILPITLAALAVLLLKTVSLNLVFLKLVAGGISLLWSTMSSISFMNVIIDDEKKAPTLFPIFLFYLYLVWFVIFI